MRKNFIAILMAVIGLTTFMSCSNSDDEDNNEPTYNVPTIKLIPVGSSFKIGPTDNWTSSNDFVASVSQNGLIQAVHVGDCVISNGRSDCKVSVTAKSNFMKEPLTTWGVSKAFVISKCGNNYMTSGESIGYSTGDSKYPLIMYMFKNDRLSGSVITVSTSYTGTLTDFLLERYYPVDKDGYDFYFINGYTTSTITTIVGLTLYNQSYWSVSYIPFNTVRGGNEIDASFRTDLMQLVEQI